MGGFEALVLVVLVLLLLFSNSSTSTCMCSRPTTSSCIRIVWRCYKILVLGGTGVKFSVFDLHISHIHLCLPFVLYL